MQVTPLDSHSAVAGKAQNFQVTIFLINKLLNYFETGSHVVLVDLKLSELLASCLLRAEIIGPHPALG